jgi:hypothetical protein
MVAANNTANLRSSMTTAILACSLLFRHNRILDERARKVPSGKTCIPPLVAAVLTFAAYGLPHNRSQRNVADRCGFVRVLLLSNQRRRTRASIVRENKERWRELCEQAAVEQDPQKLLELTRQINDLLLGKQHRLDGEASPYKPKD